MRQSYPHFTVKQLEAQRGSEQFLGRQLRLQCQLPGWCCGVMYCSGHGVGSHLWPVVILADNIHHQTLLTPRS